MSHPEFLKQKFEKAGVQRAAALCWGSGYPRKTLSPFFSRAACGGARGEEKWGTAPRPRQRDLNHTSRDMQLVYQHHLRLENTKLRERIAQRQLHGLGTYWLEQSLGLIEPDAHSAFAEGSPSLLDARWRTLLMNNPQFVQANRVSCGLCAFPQGPEECPEFMHCTEATDEGCAWFLTDPNNVDMQRELQQRADTHRVKQRESKAAGRTVQAHRYGVMAGRTERLRDTALQKASDEVRRALLDELNASGEES